MAKKPRTLTDINNDMSKAQAKMTALRQEMKEFKRQATINVGEMAAAMFPEMIDGRVAPQQWFDSVKALIAKHEPEFLMLLRKNEEIPAARPMESKPAAEEASGDIDG